MRRVSVCLIMSRQAPPPPPPATGPSSVSARRAELDDELSEVDLGAQLDVRTNLEEFREKEELLT